MRIRLHGGPFDSRYVKDRPVNTLQLIVDGHTYERETYESEIAYYVEPPAPPTELSEPQPARHTLGANDCVVIECKDAVPLEYTEHVRDTVAAAFDIDPRRVLVLDGGARLSTLTKTVALTEARIDELAKRADLTRDRAPEWFVEMVRTVEDEHGIK